MKIYIYLIINKINCKMYVGITHNPEDRFYEHCHNAGYAIGKAIRKYNKENFNFEILDHVDNYEYAGHLEQLYILFLRTMVPGGYNLTAGGEKEKTFSEESVEKMRKTKSGTKLAKQHRENIGKAQLGKKNSMYGRHHSIEVIEKIRKTKLSKHPSPETIEKFKINNRGENNPMYGRIGEKNPRYGKVMERKNGQGTTQLRD